jgi:hypothetical protein
MRKILVYLVGSKMEDIVRHCRLNTIPTNFHGLKYSNKKGDASSIPYA